MAMLQALQDIMMRVGATLDLQQVTEFAEDRAWTLVFDTTTTVDAEYDETRQRVIFTGDIGAPPAHAREKALELLLQYSYLWPEHGGVRAALDGASGRAVLMLDLAAQDIELTRFCDALSNFRAAVDEWRNVLASVTTRGGATDAFIIVVSSVLVRNTLIKAFNLIVAAAIDRLGSVCGEHAAGQGDLAPACKSVLALRTRHVDAAGVAALGLGSLVRGSFAGWFGSVQDSGHFGRQPPAAGSRSSSSPISPRRRIRR